jgi:hypothetical protein
MARGCAIQGHGLVLDLKRGGQEMHSETHMKLMMGLGLVVTRFNTLEFYMQSVLSMLLTRHQDIGNMTSSLLSFNKSIQLFDAICRRKVKTPELVKEMEALCSKLNWAEGERNKLLHSHYLASIDPEGFMRHKTNLKGTFPMHEMKPDALFELAANFATVYEAFFTFFSKLMDGAVKQKVLLHEAENI